MPTVIPAFQQLMPAKPGRAGSYVRDSSVVRTSAGLPMIAAIPAFHGRPIGTKLARDMRGRLLRE